MDTELIRRKKENLEQKKLHVAYQERVLKERERKLKAKINSKIANLASRAKLTEIDQDALYGAFLEISKLALETENIERWKKYAQKEREENKKENPSVILVSFKGNTPKDAEKILKAHAFKWNRFRKEWNGFGDVKAIQEELKDFEVKVDEFFFNN